MSKAVRASLVVILVLGCGGTYAARAWREAHKLSLADAGMIPTRLAALPLQTQSARFVGTRDYVDPEIIEKSGADHYAAIDYVDAEGGTVRLHVGAAARTDAWFHPPAVCLPAQGWTTGKTSVVPIWQDLPGVDREVRILRLTLHKAGAQLLVYYWYQYGEDFITSRAQRRRLRFLDLLAGRRDRPAQIVIFYASIEGEVERSEARISALVHALWPQLSTLLKGEA